MAGGDAGAEKGWRATDNAFDRFSSMNFWRMWSFLSAIGQARHSGTTRRPVRPYRRRSIMWHMKS